MRREAKTPRATSGQDDRPATDEAVEAVRGRQNDEEILSQRLERDLAAVGDDFGDDGIIGGGEIGVAQIVIGDPDALRRIAPGQSVSIALGAKAKTHRDPDGMAAGWMRDLPEPPRRKKRRCAAINSRDQFRVDDASLREPAVGLILRRGLKQLAAEFGSATTGQ